MTDWCEIEQRFWSKVWYCSHRHPCKMCCWPWIGNDGIAIYDDPHEAARRRFIHATFYDPRLPRPYPAHAFSYIVKKAGGILILPGRGFAICHTCDYAACCNYAHLSLGARADNDRDRRGKTRACHRLQKNILPDGRILTGFTWDKCQIVRR